MPSSVWMLSPSSHFIGLFEMLRLLLLPKSVGVFGRLPIPSSSWWLDSFGALSTVTFRFFLLFNFVSAMAELPLCLETSLVMNCPAKQWISPY